MDNRIAVAVNNLARELKMANSGKLKIKFHWLPSSIKKHDTVKSAEEKKDRISNLLKDIMQDPLEKYPRYAPIIQAAEEQADQELRDHPLRGGIGYCHIFWKRKKAILKETYRLDWKSPKELNPGTMFD
jgi:hypothetical protein